MTLGNVRANGVHTLAVWCLGRSCNHFRILDVSNYCDETSVLAFGPRLRCERCGHLGADARPNWNERDKREPIARSSNAPEPTDVCHCPKADIRGSIWNVRFVPLADNCLSMATSCEERISVTDD